MCLLCTDYDKLQKLKNVLKLRMGTTFRLLRFVIKLLAFKAYRVIVCSIGKFGILKPKWQQLPGTRSLSANTIYFHWHSVQIVLGD